MQIELKKIAFTLDPKKCSLYCIGSIAKLFHFSVVLDILVKI